MVSTIIAPGLLKAQTLAPCRSRQLQQLSIYYNHHLSSPPILVAHGPEHTEKLQCVTALLSSSNVSHAVVRTRDCLTQRHLLTKVFAACVRALKAVDQVERYDRIDGLNSLLVGLQKLFEGREEKFVLVVDGIDKQRGATYTLVPALAKLGDLVRNLSVVLTSSSSRLSVLHRSGVPFIHFPPYTRVEAIKLMLNQDIPWAPDTKDLVLIPEDEVKRIYESFVITVYDTLITHTTSNSQQAFRRTCARLWPRFISPVLSEKTPEQSNIKWDFARLLSRNRSLFQREGEQALLPSLTASIDETQTQNLPNGTDRIQQSSKSEAQPQTTNPEPPLLKYFSTLLLLSAYLASHTPPKHDIILFSRLSSSSTNKRKYLSSALSKSRTPNASGVRKLKTPTKSKPSADQSTSTPTHQPANSEGLANERTPKSTRLLLEKTSSIPRPFTLERLLAIFRTIHPDGLPRSRGAADRVYAELAELEKVRVVVRCGGGGEGRGGDDGILEEKWRVNVSRDVVVGLGRVWEVGLEGWEID